MQHFELIINSVIDKYKLEVDAKYPNNYFGNDSYNRNQFCILNREIMAQEIKQRMIDCNDVNINVNDPIIKTAVVVALNNFSNYCNNHGRL